MAIELKVVSGARAGAQRRFEQSIVAIGRHPSSDFQFDPDRDLDVSAKHAEIRESNGQYTIVDRGSTNGTFVNGRRVPGELVLNDGDRISFGANGPEVAIQITGGSEPAATHVSSAAHPVPAAPRPARRNTAERVAIAVQEHTRGLRRMLIAAIVVLGVGIALAYAIGHRESKRQVAELMQLYAQNESLTTRLQGELARAGAQSYADAIKQQNKALRSRVESNPESPQQMEALKHELEHARVVQQGLALMDLSNISERNDAGVAFIASELDGRPFGGTAFGITRGGLLVTNRHNVRSESGNPPTRIAVKYANTDTYLHARVVKVSDDKDEDLALVQIEEPGKYPTVSGVRQSLDALKVGAPLVTIGFPNGLDTPQAGETLKTSLEGGTVSKRLPSLLQVDSFAAHGSSGSPVFDTDGYVVGVVWGGDPDSQGRIVYAVPSDRLAAFLPNDARGILR